MKHSHTLSGMQSILNSESKPTANAPSTPCLAHSGFVTAFEFIAKDQDAQWSAIRSMDKRMWAVVIGVVILIGEMLIKHLIAQ